MKRCLISKLQILFRELFKGLKLLKSSFQKFFALTFENVRTMNEAEGKLEELSGFVGA